MATIIAEKDDLIRSELGFTEPRNFQKILFMSALTVENHSTASDLRACVGEHLSKTYQELLTCEINLIEL